MELRLLLIPIYKYNLNSFLLKTVSVLSQIISKSPANSGSGPGIDCEYCDCTVGNKFLHNFLVPRYYLLIVFMLIYSAGKVFRFLSNELTWNSKFNHHGYEVCLY